MSTESVVLDVPVANVADAIAFYCDVFGATLAEAGCSSACSLRLGGALLRVFDEALLPGDRVGRRFPRLEVRDGQVNGFMRRTKRAGGQSLRIARAYDGIHDTFLDLRDPFGHVWSFAFPLPKTG